MKDMIRRGLHDNNFPHPSVSSPNLTIEKEKVVTNCLQHLSRDQQLRKDWVTLIGEGFSKPVAVFVLQKICIMFVKSKH